MEFFCSFPSTWRHTTGSTTGAVTLTSDDVDLTTWTHVPMCSSMFDLVPSELLTKMVSPCTMETVKWEKKCGQWSKGALDVGDSQDGNEGGCRRRAWHTCQVFPVVSVMVWGWIPQCGILFLVSFNRPMNDFFCDARSRNSHVNCASPPMRKISNCNKTCAGMDTLPSVLLTVECHTACHMVVGVATPCPQQCHPFVHEGGSLVEDQNSN